MYRRALGLLAISALACGSDPKPGPRDPPPRRPEIVRDPDGTPWFVSGGRRYPLQRGDPRRAQRRQRLKPQLPHADTPPPERYMLDELGWVTPVDDQHNRGACTIFAALGAIESEYLRQHGLALDLSEQYVINMMNEARHPIWLGGGSAEKALVASYYAVPPEIGWPYAFEGQMVQRIDAVFGFARAGDARGGEALDARIWANSLERDLANYGAAVAPSETAHQGAVYGPMPGALAAVPLDGTATPFEQVLAAGHAISFGTDMNAWGQDASGTFVYVASTTTDVAGHAMVLVGYDRKRQVFRVKNSWGNDWNQKGFAEASYDLITQTTGGTAWVTELRAPGKVWPDAGTGALRGFWRGSLGDGDVVAVLRHPFVDPGALDLAGPDAGTLYLRDRRTRGLTWVSGAPTTMTLDVQDDPVVKRITLTRDGDGWRLAGTGTRPDGRSVTLEGRWCRTATPTQPTLTPASYLAAVNDPQVFPAGSCRSSTVTAVR